MTERPTSIILSPAAERMRRFRDRRSKASLRDYRVTRNRVRKGLLNREMRNDLNAVRNALYRLLDQTLN
jgi:hypothetical protein